MLAIVSFRSREYLLDCCHRIDIRRAVRTRQLRRAVVLPIFLASCLTGREASVGMFIDHRDVRCTSMMLESDIGLDHLIGHRLQIVHSRLSRRSFFHKRRF